MLVNVTDVFTSEGKVLTQEFAWETAEITHDGSSYPVKSSSKLLLKLTNTAQGEALVEAKLQFVAGIPCERCLEEVEVPFDLPSYRSWWHLTVLIRMLWKSRKLLWKVTR